MVIGLVNRAQQEKMEDLAAARAVMEVQVPLLVVGQAEAAADSLAAQAAALGEVPQAAQVVAGPNSAGLAFPQV